MPTPRILIACDFARVFFAENGNENSSALFALTVTIGYQAGSAGNGPLEEVLEELRANPAPDGPLGDWGPFERAANGKAAILLPWFWNPDPMVHVFRDNGAREIDGSPFSVRALGSPLPPTEEAEFRRRQWWHVSDRTEKFKHAAAFLFDAKPLDGSADAAEESAAGFSYPGFLGALAQWPSPLSATEGKAAWFLDIPTAAIADPDLLLIAAPAFTAGTSTYGPDVAASPPVFEEDRWIVKLGDIELADGGAVEVAAAAVPIRADGKRETALTEKTYVDFSNLWVKAESDAGGVLSVSTGGWLAELPDRLSPLFDLAAAICRYCEPLRPDDLSEIVDLLVEPMATEASPSLPTGICRFVGDAFIGGLRDWAGPGVRANINASHSGDPEPLFGPDEIDLATRILLRVSSTQLVPPTSLVDANDGRWEFYKELYEYDRSDRDDGGISHGPDSGEDTGSTGHWRALLIDALPELGSLMSPTEPFWITLAKLAPAERLARLQAIKAILDDEAALRRLILHQWDSAVERPGASQAARDFYTRARREVADNILPELNLRRLYGRDAMAATWEWIFAAGAADDEDAALRVNLDDAVIALFDARLGDAASGEYAKVRDHFRPSARDPSHDHVPFLENFRQRTRMAVTRALDLLLEGQDAVWLTPRPHALPIQIDRFENKGDTDDPNVDLAGYGILMRWSINENNGERLGNWRCLNVVNLAYSEPSTGQLKALTDSAGHEIETVMPIPMTVQSGLPQTIIEYDGLPIAGEMRDARVVADSPPDSGFERIIVPRVPQIGLSDRRSEWAKLPPLGFGMDYHVLPFAISNAGALPAHLQQQANGSGHIPHPGVLRAHSDAAGDLDQLHGDDNYRRTVAYRRRVGVGALRVRLDSEDPNDRRAKLALRYPRNVRPLAADLLGPDNKDSPICLLARDSDRFDPAKSTAQYRFDVRAPTCDWQTYDRWVVRDQYQSPLDSGWRELRAEIITAIHEIGDSGPDPRESLCWTPGDAIDVEDPAVTAYVVQLTCNRGPAAGSVIRMAFPTDHDPLASAVTNPLGKTWGKKLAVEITLPDGAVTGDRLSKVGDTASVRIAPGEIWTLEIHAAVPARYIDAGGHQRFDGRFANLTDLKWVPAAGADGLSEDVYVFPAYRMFLEGASKEMPLPNELFSWIETNVDDSGALTLSLKRDSAHRYEAVSFKPADNIGEVEFLWQRFRWTGRPTTRFPFEFDENAIPVVAPDSTDLLSRPETNAQVWDAEGFGERADDDGIGGSAAVIASAPETILFREGSGPDRRQHYYRFRATALHRFRDLLAEGVPFKCEAERRNADPAVDLLTRTQWRRQLRRCTWRDTVPPPNVKLVLPLTRPVDAAAGADTPRAADLLVVLDEPWGMMGGGAEYLDVEAVMISRRESGADSPRIGLPEYGPDPVVWQEGMPAHDDTAVDRRLYVPLFARGPIGHTFDTDTATPLFVSSSFVVPPPQFNYARTKPGAEDARSREHEWAMTRLRFRRLLLPEATEGYAPPSSDVVVSGQPVEVPLAVGRQQFAITVAQLRCADSPADRPPAQHKATAVRIELVQTGGPGALSCMAASIPSQGNIAWTIEPHSLDANLVTGIVAHYRFAPTTIDGLDLRVIGNRVAGIEEGGTGSDIAHWHLALYARSSSENWIRLGAAVWPAGESNLGASLRIVKVSGADAQMRRLVTPWHDVRLSGFTDSSWVQFLPARHNLIEAEKLGSMGFAVAYQSPKRIKIRSKGVADDLSWWVGRMDAPESGATKQGMFHWALVTRQVARADSSDPRDLAESYVGLFDLEIKRPGELVLRRVGLGNDLAESDRLFARIMMMQQVPRRAGKDDDELREHGYPSPVEIADGDDPWKWLFPPRLDPKQPPGPYDKADPEAALIRILEIYGPMGDVPDKRSSARTR